jgi:hypothetical protein
MSVLRIGGAVQAHSHPDVEFAEQPEVRVIQPDRIRLHPCVDLRARTDRVSCRGYQKGDEFASGQQRLTAMQDQDYLLQPVCTSMLAYTRGGMFGYLHGHSPRLVSPRLISHFIHVAVVAGKITSTVDLKDEFTKGDWIPPVRDESWNIQALWPLKPGFRPHKIIKHT